MNDGYTPGALYIAGFTQARSPHIGLLLATSPSEGTLFHIRIDRSVGPNWYFQPRRQPVVGDMFLSSLTRITQDPLPLEQAEATLEEAARTVAPPLNDEFGECAPWVYDVVDLLSTKGTLTLIDREKLAEEVDSFATSSRTFARRDRFPNVAVSQYCH